MTTELLKKFPFGTFRNACGQHLECTKVRNVVGNYLMVRPLVGKADVLTILWVAS